jgi:hypothetical protein
MRRPQRSGDCVFESEDSYRLRRVPDVPHSQRRVVAGEGRQLVLVSPGGLEGFFRELAAAYRAGTLGPDAYANASRRYGVSWVG